MDAAKEGAKMDYCRMHAPLCFAYPAPPTFVLQDSLRVLPSTAAGLATEQAAGDHQSHQRAHHTVQHANHASRAKLCLQHAPQGVGQVQQQPLSKAVRLSTCRERPPLKTETRQAV